MRILRNVFIFFSFLIVGYFVATNGIQMQEASYYEVVQSLHGAKTVDTEQLEPEIRSLLEQARDDDIKGAIPPLEHALKSQNPAVLYHDIMSAWYLTDPENALSFLFQKTEEELNKVHANQADTSVAKVDYQLLVSFLKVLVDVKDTQVVNRVVRDLEKKSFWFSSRGDLAFFTMSLELDWLQMILLVRQETLETIKESLTFAVEFQKKLLSLGRFSKEAEYDVTIQRLSLMQGQMAVQLLRGLSTIKENKPAITQVEQLLGASVKLILSERTDLGTMNKVLTNLKLAYGLLDKKIAK